MTIPTQKTQTQAPTTPARRKLTLKRETLRRLTPVELRLVAGGVGCQEGKHFPKTIVVV